MNTRIRYATLIAGLAVATPLALAGPAMASGASHGGGTWTCGVPATQTMPGVTAQQTFPVLQAGTVTVKRDAANDGLVVGKVVANAGWSKSVPTPSGPKITVQFQQSKTKVEFEAAQSAQYYGPDVLVIEIKTCSR